MLRFSCGILMFVLCYIVPIYSTEECSTNCTLKKGRRTVGNESVGPPRLKFKTTSNTVKLLSTIGLKCRVCQSNPASTLQWLFNGKPLQFKRDRMHITSTACQQTLFLLTVLREDEGNYTCVAKNTYGEAKSTKEVKILDGGCSNKCQLIDEKHKVGRKLGPPKIRLMEPKIWTTVNSMFTLECSLCQSNPPSSLSWFYNGIPLDLKRNKIQLIPGWCEETLYFRASNVNAGNYTCMAKNKFGQAKSTTELRVADNQKPEPRVNIKVEAPAGSLNGNDVKIGSRINITCTMLTFNCFAFRWLWKKNGKVIKQNETEAIKGCTTKLVIDEVMSNSTGNYQCIAPAWSLYDLAAKTNTNDISINAVPCFGGYYCPRTAKGARRCPNGTFTMLQNATNVEQCKICPTGTGDETLIALKHKNPQTAKNFRINCPHYRIAANSDEDSSLSHGEIAAIAVSLTVLIIVVILASLFGIRNCRDYKKLTNRPAEDIQIEIPDVPQPKDVFVCYSSKNREWVHEMLLSNLRAQDFETFIDFKDFEIGLAIHQNIVNGIYGCRKTIFVLSKDSLRSYYARTELSQALAARRQTGHQVIVILYEKCKVPEEISNIVYLDWTDEEKRDQFWEKLYEAVRKPLANEV